MLHGSAARLMWYCDAPVVVIRISIENYEDARETLKHCHPSPVPSNVRHVVMLFQVQRPWSMTETSLWFVLACTSPVLPHLRAWQTLSIVIQDGGDSPEQHTPSNSSCDPAQDQATEDVASVAQFVNAALANYRSGSSHQPATPRNTPEGSGSSTPIWQPNRDEAFRTPSFDPDLLPTRQLVSSCLSVCHTWGRLAMWDMPLPITGRLAALRPQIRFTTLTELNRVLGPQMMRFATDGGDGAVFEPALQ